MIALVLALALVTLCESTFSPLRRRHRSREERDHGCQGVQTCRERLKDFIETPEEDWWTSVFQVAFPQYNRFPPPYVVTPRTAEEVREAMECLHKEGTRVSVKGGGHNYAGFSAANGREGGVQLNLKRNMRSIVDVSSEWNGTPAIRGEAGLVFRDVYLWLNDTSNNLSEYLLAGGFCPTVGIAGFHLAGGLGALSQEFGLGVDNVLQVTMVTANGSAIVNASATENADLFWALRGGGGGSLGVVTHFVLRLHPLTALFPEPKKPMYTYGEFCVAPSMSSPGEIKLELLRFAQHYDDIPRWLTISWRLVKTEQAKGLCYLFYSLRSWEETRPILSPIINLPSSDDGILLGSYPEGESNADLSDNLLALNGPSFVKNFTNFLEMELANAAYKGYDEFFTTPLVNQGCVIERLSPEALVNAIVDHWHTEMPDATANGNTGQHCYIQGMVLGSGKVATVDPNATSFFWRTSAYASDSECQYRNAAEKEKAFNFTGGYREALGEYCQGAFLNFPVIEMANYASQYWGDNLPRLSSIRQQWNPVGPSNILRFSQEIPA